jgi:hypothetical protein
VDLIQHPLYEPTDRIESISPTIHPLWVFYILVFAFGFVNGCLYGAIATAPAPVSPEEHMVNYGVRANPVISVARFVYLHLFSFSIVSDCQGPSIPDQI